MLLIKTKVIKKTTKTKKKDSVFRDVRERLGLTGEGGRYKFWKLLEPYGYTRSTVYRLDESATSIHPSRVYDLQQAVKDISDIDAKELLYMCKHPGAKRGISKS